MSTTTAKGKVTPFAKAVHVQPIAGSDSLFTATVPQDWSGVPAAHGGYLQSLVFSTARTYFLTHHPTRNQPDPISSHINFLKSVPTGPIRLCVRAINLGSRVSVIQIEIQNKERNSGNFKTLLLAVVTQGNLATEEGSTLPTEPTLTSGDIPDRELECEEFVLASFIKKVAPGSFKVDGRVVKGYADGCFSDHRGRSYREIWYRFSDGTPWDVLSLGYLTDLFLGAPNNYCMHQDDYESGVTYPTLTMATEIKKDPKGAEWLFMRMRTHQIKNGRFDTQVVVVDEGGDLVAMSKHVSLILARKEPEEWKGLHRL